MTAAAVKALPIEIRPASEADAGIIRTLALRIWPDCFAGIIAPHMLENMMERIYSLNSLQEQMRVGQRFWIATYEGRPAGYVSAYRDGESVWLKKLYCDTGLHGQGIGTAMMHKALAAFAPARDVRLLVNRENMAAQGYYERMGFVRTEEVPVMMGDFPFVDYLYVKPLGEK